jgi:nitrate reductase beta subunit
VRVRLRGVGLIKCVVCCVRIGRGFADTCSMTGVGDRLSMKGFLEFWVEPIMA